jgi:uncharacterized protein YciI
MRDNDGAGEATVATFAVMMTVGDRDLRDKARPSHREYLQEQLDAGTLVTSGPYADDSGALLIYEAASTEALQQILNNDPYWMTTGVIDSVVIKEWNVVFQRS